MTACTVDGCSQPTVAKGLCSKHYQRYRRHGDPLHTEVIRGDDVARFWSHVELTPNCWIWRGGLFSDGYGSFSVTGKNVRAHRYAYKALGYEIPEGLSLDHLCRNRACVRPFHLEPVTGRENTRRSPIAPAAINARKTHCVYGHEFTPETTRITRSGHRCCRPCCRDRQREQRRRMKTPDWIVRSTIRALAKAIADGSKDDRLLPAMIRLTAVLP